MLNLIWGLDEPYRLSVEETAEQEVEMNGKPFDREPSRLPSDGATHGPPSEVRDASSVESKHHSSGEESRKGATVGHSRGQFSEHSSEHRRLELADFLRTRREKLKPEQVGIAQLSRRRTPGLRREEVAELAGVGTTWYTWLEQARDIQPSSEVLRRLGNALNLNPAEMRHLFSLAGKSFASAVAPGTETVSASLRRLIDHAVSVPALVLGYRWDVITWNAPAAAMLPDLLSLAPENRNWLYHVFFNDVVDRVERWEDHARRLVAEFRASVSDSLDSPWVTELVELMKSRSPQFTQWWREHDVRDRQPVIIQVTSPEKGPVLYERTILKTAEEPKLTILIFTPTT